MRILILSTLVLAMLSGTAQKEHRRLVTTADRELIPEGIAVHKGTIYISSINKHLIVVVDTHGKTKNFITPEQDGFLEGLGMKVDKRGWLWALSNKKDGNVYTSQVHAFDLKTGKTKQQYKIRDTIPHLFNDLEIDADGTIYLTDTYYSGLYKVNPRSRKLELFLKSPFLDYPNGLALNGSGSLYIATYEHGLMQLQLKTKTLKPLLGYADSAIAHGLDGLVYWKGRLTGIYNGSENRSGNAVVQYQLDKSGEKIIGETILDKGNPDFWEPTTVARAGNTLYVLANSHLALYNQNKTSTKGIEGKLLPPIVLLYNLVK